MRILWIQDSPSLIGGCEQYIYQTVQLLNEQRITSSLLYNPLCPADIEFLRPFFQAFPLVDIYKQLECIPHDLVFVHQLASPEPLKALVCSSKPVIRFFHDHRLFCLRGSKLSLFSNRPCLVPVDQCCSPWHASIVRKNNLFGFSIRTLSQLQAQLELNKRLDGFLAPSSYMAEHIARHGFDKNKIEKIPLYAKEPANRPGAFEREKRLLLFVGQLLRGKGVDVLLHAMTLTKEKYRLAILGAGKQCQVYRKLAEKLRIDSQIEFLGKVPQEELEAWYQRAGCVVFPVRIPETFALIGPEAMRFGTPVIASSLGGISEWLDPEKTGLTVPCNDPKALAEAIDRLCLTPGLIERMGKQAIISYQEKFRPEAHLAKLLRYFEGKIEEKRKQNENRWGRFTAVGSPGIENTAREILSSVESVVKSDMPLDSLRAVLLIGGYGKGEGGIEKKAEREYLHNNLDLLLVTKGMNLRKQREIADRLHRKLTPLCNVYEVDIDVGTVDHVHLRRSPTLLMWHDMYDGHKLIWGDAQYMAALPFGNPGAIPPGDMMALMVNRGTLLLINDQLLEMKAALSLEDKKKIVRHIMKAIIGFGDALLYFMGRYHWSYREKMDRMAKADSIPLSFRRLYREASLFRFETAYASYLNLDLANWNSKVKNILKEIFLKTSALFLKNQSLTSDTFLDSYLSHSIRKAMSSTNDLKQAVKGMMAPPGQFVGKTLREKLGFYLLSPKERLLVPFAMLAFGIGGKEFQCQLCGFLKTGEASGDPEAAEQLRRAYLAAWGFFNDPKLCDSLACNFSYS